MTKLLIVLYIFGVLLGVYGHDVKRLRRDVCVPEVAPPSPKSDCCGQHYEPRLLGGNRTEIDEHPWIALVEYEDKGINKLLCAGALISGRYVLAGAHCLSGDVLKNRKPVNVRLGEFDTSTDGPDCMSYGAQGQDCTDGAINIPIEKIIVHPNFSNKPVKNDIALIKLANNAPYTDFIRPVCLPTLDANEDQNEIHHLSVVGWALKGGIKNTIKEKYMTNFVDIDKCNEEYKENNIMITKDNICADDTSCVYSALYNSRQHYNEIIGLLSFGATKCGISLKPTVYTNVYKYIEWIKENMV